MVKHRTVRSAKPDGLAQGIELVANAKSGKIENQGSLGIAPKFGG